MNKNLIGEENNIIFYGDEKWKEEVKKYNDMCKSAQIDLYNLLSKEELEKLYSWPKSEIEIDYPHIDLCSDPDNYKRLSEIIPKNFTVIDIGCYQACQSAYFEDFNNYIGIDSNVPIKYRLNRGNAIHYLMKYQDFVTDIMPELISNGVINLDTTVVISNLVPGLEYEFLESNFKYFYLYYPSYDKNACQLPKNDNINKALYPKRFNL